MELEGKTALVFGAGSIGPGWGNGKACTVAYARADATDSAAIKKVVDKALETVEMNEEPGLGASIADEYLKDC